MDELVRRADVLKMLHEMGGCDAASDSWADGWDKAIDAAFDKVEGMKPVEPSKMEDRDAIRRPKLYDATRTVPTPETV